MTSHSTVFHSVTAWTVAYQALLSMEFSRQEDCNGLPFPTPGDLPNLGIKPMSPALAGGFFTTRSTWENISSVQFRLSVVSGSLRPHRLQYITFPCPSPTPRVYSNSCPSSQWCHPTISSLSSPSPLAPNSSQHQSLFQWVNSSHEVAKVLEYQR